LKTLFDIIIRFLRLCAPNGAYGRALAVLMLMVMVWMPDAQAVTRPFTARFTLNAAGDITITGNMSLHCSTATGATGLANCPTARSSSAGTLNNNAFTMVNLDVDANAVTFNSTSAKLIIPPTSSVAFAGLYWGGVTSTAAASVGRNNVWLATPSGGATYQTITATVVNDRAASGTVTGDYQAFADVTSIIATNGGGTYTVANVATSSNAAGLYAGWSLVVVYRDATQPTRNMVVYDGYQVVATATPVVDIVLTGFTTPPAGTVTSKLGVVAYDGDRGSAEGTAGLQFGTSTASLSPVTNTLNPQTDVFNSTISTLGVNNADRNPNYLNTLGFDIDMFSPNVQLPNGATQAVVRINSTVETIIPGVITLATNIFVPNIKDSFIKSVKDVNGGLVMPGDVLEYTIQFSNTGNDIATNTVLIDAIPANTTYVPGSIVLSSTSTGMPTGARTDSTGDDAAEFDAVNNRIIVRIGRSATAVLGGALNPGDGQTLKFSVTVNASTPGETSITNSASISYQAQTLGTLYNDISDSNAVDAGDQPATVVTASADLTIAKTHSPSAFVQGSVLPTTPTFSIVVANTGSAASFGTVTVVDLLPAGFTALSLAGPGWSCTLAALSCTRTDTLAVSATYPTITLMVSASNSGSFTNSATVSCACEGVSKTGNNTAFDPVTVVAAVHLSVTKTNGVTNVVAGQTTSYTVTVTNLGPANAAGAVLTDPAIDGLSCTSASCGVASGSAVCPASATLLADIQAGVSIPSMSANSSLSFVINCNVTATGQ
jgi:uncharacterized repeat protein (TIGR01451 family)